MAVVLHSSNSRLHLAEDIPTRPPPPLRRQAVIRHHANRRPAAVTRRNDKDLGDDALATNLSAIYGKLLVVLGIALPVTETILPTDSITTYDSFYLYLYVGSIAFLLYIYATFLKDEAIQTTWESRSRKISTVNNQAQNEVEVDDKSDSDSQTRRKIRYGSFYLRMGVGAFGVGSIIFSVLSFARYWELKSTKECDDTLIAITPMVKAIFVMAQIVFVFSDANKFIGVKKHALVARFGIMHMIAANLCEWLFVVVQETKLDIVRHFKNPKHALLQDLTRDPLYAATDRDLGKDIDINETEDSSGMEVENETDDISFSYSPLDKCLNTHIMNQLLRKASPFLFPCSVEYSLLCAVILAVMWNTACHSSLRDKDRGDEAETSAVEKQSGVNVIYMRSASQFSVDCANANKGLFGGMLIFVMTVISLIMFFELVEQDRYKEVAVFQVNVWEAIVYQTSAIACVICLLQMRKIGLRKTRRNLELEHVLLFVTQSGIFLYTLFQIIGAYFIMRSGRSGCIMRIVTPASALVQSMLQTMLVLDAWKRKCETRDELRTKPGRHLITFLLIANMSVWISHKLKNNRAEFHPMQMDFYGAWAWTIITHVTMPLLSCYRFQSAVCLYEIWKHVYKMRQL